MSTSGSHYKPVPIAVDGTVTLLGSRVGGLLCTTSGSFTFTLIGEDGTSVALPAIPLTAGQSFDIPFFAGTRQRSTVAASGGGAGIVFVA